MSGSRPHNASQTHLFNAFHRLLLGKPKPGDVDAGSLVGSKLNDTERNELTVAAAAAVAADGIASGKCSPPVRHHCYKPAFVCVVRACVEREGRGAGLLLLLC